MDFLKKAALTIAAVISSSFLFACHDVTVTEIAAVDNGNNTYTYQFEVCFGTGAGSETYGFWLNFAGGNLIGYDPSVTGPTTGNVKSASVPPVSGNGAIEYGDWNNTGSPLLSDINNLDCIIVTLTFDAPITSVTFGGVQPDIGCAPETVPTTSSCFSPDYTVELSTKNCKGDPVIWNIEDLNGNPIGGGSLSQDGLTQTYEFCGCGAELNISVPTGNGNGACDGGLNPDIKVYDVNGNLLVSPSTSGSYLLDCTILPVESNESNVIFDKSVSANRISWSTVSEQDNDYFSVLHSADGKNWRVIDKIAGAGNSNSLKKYEIVHDGYKSDLINYYKIAQTDYDGTTTNIKILSIQNGQDKELIQTFNMMGQEVDENYKGIVIRYFSDGSTEKTYSR